MPRRFSESGNDMDWRDRLVIPGRLRLRFVVAAGLLVLTTVTASVWTFFALTRLSGIVTDTVQQSESVTAVTSRLAGALEREDDAVLLILAGDDRGTQVLARERTVVDRAVADLFQVLGPDDERELANPLRAELQAYRQASDAVVSVASEREALVEYHQKANPVLRRGVALTTRIRDRHFALAREAVGGARDEAAAARRAVLLITLAALVIAVAVAWHLTRTVVGPLRRLTDGANAIRSGNFSERINVSSRDELGELAGAFNQMAEDLAEFRRTNVSEVVRAKNTLEATLEALPDAVVLLDGTGRIQSMNRAAVTTLASAGVHDPQRLEDLRIEGLDLNAVVRAVSTGTDVVNPPDLTQTIRVERDGTVQRLLPRVVPVSALNPHQRGVILLLYEVTDLVRLDEMRSELVAVASHELQTPLTTLRMTLHMLKEASDTLPERQRQLVDTSLIGVDQLTSTVHEFLDLTRIEAGQLRLNLEPVQAAAVVAEAIVRVEGQAAAQGILVTNQIDAGLPHLVADPLRLRAVFDNILSNALKYTPRGGTVTLESGVAAAANGQAEAVSISITDTGPGIPAAYHSRVFDKFFRLEHHHAEARPGARGAGIGLYMCKQIVELHGGTITCGAGLEGSGTRITVTLPAALQSTDIIDETVSYAAR
jgi:signal transduction histidine kinase/HAMP domain-containing protein